MTVERHTVPLIVIQELIIARDDRPEAGATPAGDSEGLPRFGFYPGRLDVPADFDSMAGHAIAAMFDGTWQNSQE